MQLTSRPDPTPASKIIQHNAVSYQSLGITKLQETSPTSILATVDPARSRNEAANIAALIDPAPEWGQRPVHISVEHAEGPIDPMRASRAGMEQALASLYAMQISDYGPNRIVATAMDKSHASASLRTSDLRDIVNDVVQLPSIPGLPTPPPIEIQIGARAEAAWEHNHSPIIL